VAETVNIHYAKTNLSKLIERAERGEEIVIARAGKPVAKLSAAQPAGKRELGFMRGVFEFPPEFFDPKLDAEIAEEFLNGPVFPDEDTP